jgi:hypothetical protein
MKQFLRVVCRKGNLNGEELNKLLNYYEEEFGKFPYGKTIGEEIDIMIRDLIWKVSGGEWD